MADDSCEALIAAARGWKGDSPTGAMLTSTRVFLSAASADPALLEKIAVSLGHYDQGAAAWVAVTCGTAVERGAPAQLAGPAIVDLFRSWLPRLPRLSEDADATPPDPTPEQAALFVLFRYLSQAVVTHLARLPAQREAMGHEPALVDRLGELTGYAHGAVWVREALLKSSGTLVFLHPASSAGLRLGYTNVSNCFHLFSLLQTAIGTRIEGGREPSDVIARVARGKSTETAGDAAWWHYGQATSPKADLATSIWGEGLVREIPQVDGVPVILAFPKILENREWDAGFLGPHLEALPSDVVIAGALTADEVRQWLERLGFGSRKRWWNR